MTQLLLLTGKKTALLICYLWAALTLLSGCTTLGSTKIAPPDENDLAKILIFPDNISATALADPAVDFLAITPEMKKFVATYVPDDASKEDKLEKLFTAISYQPDNRIQYDAQATLTAANVFRDRLGNCLSFSAMFIVLAREAGLTASFQQVDVPPSWDALSDEVLIQYRHVNVKIKLKKKGDGIIDFRIDRYSETYPQKILSDEAGLALYYSNISMQHVVDGDFERAYVAIRRAINADNKTSFIWNNMGIVQRRLGNIKLAEASYRQALQLDPKDWSALNNLAYIYDLNGDVEGANELRRLSDNYKLRNPYYRYALAQYAFRNGKFNEALVHVNEAVSKRSYEHRFHFLRGLIFWQLDDHENAIKNARKAIALIESSSFQRSDIDITLARYEKQLNAWLNQ